jgi:DNA-binding Lrp family transcriptional regulator
MVAAYILIQTEVGTIGKVVKGLRDVDGVRSAEGVTGPYDVIARAESDSLDGLGVLVVSRVQVVPGIIRTLTCPVLHLEASGPA